MAGRFSLLELDPQSLIIICDSYRLNSVGFGAQMRAHTHVQCENDSKRFFLASLDGNGNGKRKKQRQRKLAAISSSVSTMIIVQFIQLVIIDFFSFELVYHIHAEDVYHSRIRFISMCQLWFCLNSYAIAHRSKQERRKPVISPKNVIIWSNNNYSICM